MKITTFLFACAALVFTGCSQFEEGPEFSLRSKTARLAGDWVSTDVSVPGEEQPEGLPSFEASFDKEGTYSLTAIYADPFGGEGFEEVTQGDWSWTSDADLELVDLNGVREWNVVRLTSDEIIVDTGSLRIVMEKM